jgi:hypothetical protein
MRLAERTFTDADQQRFAAASGDHNPMHMDALLARRTQAGSQVVHGIHLLLWTLDALAAAQPELPPLCKLRAHFTRFVYLNEPAEIVLMQQNSTRARLSVLVDGIVRSKFNFECGDLVGRVPDWLQASLEEIAFSPVPMDVKFEEMSGQSGRVAFQMTSKDAAAIFPAATRWLGGRRVAALAASTHLVGMVFPGLHSIYSDLAVSRCADDDAEEFLGFRVMDADTRFRTVDHEIAGGGWTGIVKSVARKPPVAQATMGSLAGVVGSEEFAGAVALIIGGSRGLGELTAKLIAKGGGRPIITWQRGKADAERVAGEVRAAGGACETLNYDARKPVGEQLALLSEVPTHMYYFATPPIFRTQSNLFVSARFKEFLTVYVDGFWELVQALRARQPRLSLYYPSSVSVQERPMGMTEYTMAKAAGEALCADMNVSFAPMRVTQSRLPRLPTDQTASVADVETADAVETLLPIIREVQSWPR